jgi:hypothetical protein
MIDQVVQMTMMLGSAHDYVRGKGDTHDEDDNDDTMEDECSKENKSCMSNVFYRCNARA